MKISNQIKKNGPTAKWAFFLILFICNTLFPHVAHSSDLFVIGRFESSINNFKKEEFISSLQNQLKRDLGLSKKIWISHPDEFIKVKKQLKKNDLVINLIFGFEDVLYAFKKNNYACANLVKSGEIDYEQLLNPYFKDLEIWQQFIEKKSARLESIWMGGVLKRKLILERLLKCDLEKMKLGPSESYSRLLDTVSLKNYPVIMSNLLNLDKRFQRPEGDKIDSNEVYDVLSKGIVALLVPELIK